MKYLYLFLLFGFSHTLFSQQRITPEEAVLLAFQKNKDLQSQQLRRLSADMNLRYAVGGFLPQVTLTGSKQWNNNNQKASFETFDRSLNGVKSNNLNASAQLSWTLFDGGRMFSTYERFKEMTRVEKDSLTQTMNNVAAQTLTQYFLWIRNGKQEEAMRKLMELNTERVKIAELKLTSGLGSKQEYLQARIDLNTQQANLWQQETATRQAKQTLLGLLAFGTDESFVSVDTIPLLPSLTWDEVKKTADENNLALKVAAGNMRVAQLALKESNRARSPIVNFLMAYNYAKTINQTVVNPNAIPLQSRSDGYNYGLSVSLPLLTNLSASRQIQRSKFLVMQREILLDQQKILLNVSLYNAWQAYQQAWNVLKVQEENLKLAKENVAISWASFRTGLTNYIELRTSQQSLSDAYSLYYGSLFIAKQQEIELMRLQGKLVN